MSKTTAKLPPISNERKTEYVQGFVDAELKAAVVKTLKKKKLKIRDGLNRGLLHVLNELNPRAAKKLLHLVK